MDLKCEFCDKKFSTKSNLSNHQKTTKYCLILQGKENENKKYKCDLCEKEFTVNQNLREHYVNCLKINNKYTEKLKKQEEKYQDELRTKDNLIIQFKEKEKQKDEYISKLEKSLNKANQTIAEIAKQPKTTNNNSDNRVNNNYITNNFDINDIKKISDVLDNHLTPDVLRRGQEGIADMLKNNLLQTENGEPIYECTDVARQKFEFRNADGNIETDPKATKLIRNLGRSGMWNKSHSTAKKLWEKDDGTINYDAQTTFMPQVTDVLDIDKDSSKFRRHLASITARQRANSNIKI